MSGGVRMMLVPDDIEGNPVEQESLQEIVRKEIKRDRKKSKKQNDGSQTMELLADTQVLSAISNSQQQLLWVLQNPPRDPATGGVVTSLSNPPVFGPAERAVLAWNANTNYTIAAATYNAISGIRAEVLIGFLTHGLDPRGKKSGLFGGGIGGLLIVSQLAGGGGGLFNLFGGGTAGINSNVQLWGGIL